MPPAGPSALDQTFTATLERSDRRDGRTFVRTDWSAELLGTRGLMKVRGTIDGHPFQGSFTALGDGTHELPVTAAFRAATSEQAGDIVTVHLGERLARR